MLVQNLAPKLAVGDFLGDDIHISRLVFDTVHRRHHSDSARVWRCGNHEVGGVVGASLDGLVSPTPTRINSTSTTMVNNAVRLGDDGIWSP